MLSTTTEGQRTATWNVGPRGEIEVTAMRDPVLVEGEWPTGVPARMCGGGHVSFAEPQPLADLRNLLPNYGPLWDAVTEGRRQQQYAHQQTSETAHLHAAFFDLPRSM